MDNPAPPSAPAPEPKPQPEPPAKTPADAGPWRKPAGVIVSIVVILGAVALSLYAWDVSERHPRTDDAILRANVVGIAARVRGQIIKLNVQDNQSVNAGDVLFEIDPADYELALAKAEADLATIDQQIEVARAQDSQLKFEVHAAEAAVEAARAELKQTGNTLQRMQPLLTNGFAKEDDVDRAATAKAVAASTLAGAEQKLNQAQSALSALKTLTAQREAAVAAVNLVKLELSYCKVVAPFPGRVISLNLSEGANVGAGIPDCFPLLDTRKWYVMANFREGEIRHFSSGATAEVYLPAMPSRHFAGKVQGIRLGGRTDRRSGYSSRLAMHVKRELNWVHIAQRFPVRIEIENPDQELFRMGASAVAIIK